MRNAKETPPIRPVDLVIARIQAGVEREKNFEWLFRQYHRFVHRFFVRSGRTQEQADDLTQETFLQIQKSFHGFRFEARFETWLIEIARNVHRQELRRNSAAKRSRDETSLDHWTDRQLPLEFAEVGSPDALHLALMREQVLFLLESLDELPTQMRLCVKLRLVEGLRYREIAETLQLSIDVVKVQLARGRGRLRRLLIYHFAE